jgi:O-antigen/teichoic acid export membrane protein
VLPAATQLLRLKSFDTSSASGRAKERYRRIAIASVVSIAAKIVGLLTSVISVPLTLHYLGGERYGLWLTTSSLLAFISFADLGVGNGLLNAISTANGRDDRTAARLFVSSGSFILLGLAGLIVGVFAVTYPVVPWGRVFNLNTEDGIREVGLTVAVLVCCFAVNMPLDVVQRVQAGYQESFASSLWQIGGSLLGLLTLVLVVHMRGGLPWLAFAVAGAPVAVTGVNWATQFCWSRRWLFPRPADFDWRSGLSLLHTGSLFVVLQIVVAAAFSSDNLILTHILGTAAVAQYAVAQRLFFVAPILVGLAVAPLWPAYGEALARADRRWVRHTLRYSLGFSILASAVPALGLILLAPVVFSTWVGHQLVPPISLTVALALWSVMYSVGTAIAMLLNAANILRFQVYIASAMAVSSIFLKIYMTNIYGISGVVWGTVVAYGLFSLLPTFMYLRYRMVL